MEITRGKREDKLCTSSERVLSTHTNFHKFCMYCPNQECWITWVTESLKNKYDPTYLFLYLGSTWGSGSLHSPTIQLSNTAFSSRIGTYTDVTSIILAPVVCIIPDIACATPTPRPLWIHFLVKRLSPRYNALYFVSWCDFPLIILRIRWELSEEQ
jgi:hypothetical protein